MRIARTFFLCTAMLAFPTGLSRAGNCPFCSAPSLTLSEQLAQSDAAVLVQWAGGKKAEQKKPGNTTYEIVQVVKGPQGALKTRGGSGYK